MHGRYDFQTHPPFTNSGIFLLNFMMLYRGTTIKIFLKGKRVNIPFISDGAKFPTAAAVGAQNLTGVKFFSLASSKKQNGSISRRSV